MAVMKFITKNHPNSKYKTKYQDDMAYADLIRYVFDPKKTNHFIGGWGVDTKYADYEMAMVTYLYHKEKGVKLRHWVVSFTREDLIHLEERSHQEFQYSLGYIGYQLTSFYLNRYQIVFGVHWVDEDFPHIHIIMNTTSYMDGKKFHGDRNEYHDYELFAKQVLANYGLPLFITKDHRSSKYY